MRYSLLGEVPSKFYEHLRRCINQNAQRFRGDRFGDEVMIMINEELTGYAVAFELDEPGKPIAIRWNTETDYTAFLLRWM